MQLVRLSLTPESYYRNVCETPEESHLSIVSDEIKMQNFKLSTHVLDLTVGKPAVGVNIEFRRVDPSPALLATVITNHDGRVDEPLLCGEQLEMGLYELHFHVGSYFKSCSVDSPFIDIVPVRFSIFECKSNYHVPLLVTPWSYSTYRGS